MSGSNPHSNRPTLWIMTGISFRGCSYIRIRFVRVISLHMIDPSWCQFQYTGLNQGRTFFKLIPSSADSLFVICMMFGSCAFWVAIDSLCLLCRLLLFLCAIKVNDRSLCAKSFFFEKFFRAYYCGTQY